MKGKNRLGEEVYNIGLVMMGMHHSGLPLIKDLLWSCEECDELITFCCWHLQVRITFSAKVMLFLEAILSQ